MRVRILRRWYETSNFANFVVSLVHLVPETLFSVAWYQFYLAGPARAVPAWFPSWTSRHWRFLGYALALNFLIFAMIDGPWWYWNDAIVFVIALATIVVMLYITMRFSLIFPAISIDQVYGLARSWRLTTGNGWRIFFACWLIIIPVIILVILIEFNTFLGMGIYFYSLFPSMGLGVGGIRFLWGLSLAKEFILVLVGYGVIGICVVVTSIAYQFCTALQPPATGAGPEA